MKNKKILFVNSIIGTGSTGRLITGLCRALSAEGVQSLVCYGRKSAPGEVPCYRIGSDQGVYVHGMISRLTDRHGLYSSRATKALVRQIASFGPDLIHLHNIHGYYLNYEILFRFLREYGRPILWTLHDCWSFTGHCTHFEYIGCKRWQEQCRDCMQLREYPKSVLLDASETNYRKKKELFTGIRDLSLITPSAWLKGKTEQSFLKGYPVSVIPTGIDLSQFQPTQSALREQYGLQDKTVLLGVANPWRERKGLEDFIRLSSMLPENVRIVMIGLKKRQLSLIPKNVIGIEKTDSVKEMAAWYSLADLHVNLTYEDTFPTTNLESMACGSPVLTYGAGGSPESVAEGCGFVLPVGDLEGVRRIVSEYGRKNEVTVKACIRQAAKYDKAVRFREYIEKYEEILHQV